MIGVRSHLLSLMQKWDASFDVANPAFLRQVVEPLESYLGEGDLDADPALILRNRLLTQFPNIDGSVLADSVGTIAEALLRPIRSEIRAGINKRDLSASASYTLEDLQELRDAFFVAPAAGGFARGTFRVMFTAPRRVLFGPATIFVVPPSGTSVERRYRADATIDVPQDVMRGNRIGTLYFVDVPAISLNTGPEYNIDVNTVVSASSVPGAARIVVSQRFTDGAVSETSVSLPNAIRRAIRLRTTATPDGLRYVLGEQGFQNTYVVSPGDSLMTRDRVYGVTALGGIPGGYRSDVEAPTSDFVHIGLATDVWTYVTDAPQTLKITNVVNVGVQSAFPFAARIIDSNTIETAYRMFDFAARDEQHRADDRMLGSSVTESVGEGYVLVTDSALVRGTGLHRPTTVTAVVDEKELTVLRYATTEWNSFIGRLLWFKSITPASVSLNYGLEQAVCIPIPSEYAKAADGSASRTSNALSVPSVKDPEVPALLNGATVATSFNVFDQQTSWPIVRIDRIGLVNGTSGSASTEFIHRAVPYFCEFVGAEPNASPAGYTPIRVRVHVFGPTAMAVDGVLEGAAASGQYDPVFTDDLEDPRKFTALYWSSVSFTAVSDIAGAVETDILSLIGVNTNTPLSDFDGNPVLDRGSVRTISVGDHVVNPATGETYPIVQIINASRVRVAQKDITIGSTVTGAKVLQGCSRQSLLGESTVNAEGTWSFDFFAAFRSFPSDDADKVYPSQNTAIIPTMAPFSKYNQGFSVYTDNPDSSFSTRAADTLVLHSKWVCDSAEVTGRSLNLHGQLGSKINEVQTYLDANRPVGGDILCRSAAPAYVTLAVYYEVFDASVTPGRVAELIVEEINRSNEDVRVELTDLIDVVRKAGAQYVTSGRMFVSQQDHLRRWSWFATRGAVVRNLTSVLVPWRISVFRLKTRKPGESLDETDPDNWIDSFTLRLGGFDAD
jgi:hypothetical protein